MLHELKINARKEFIHDEGALVALTSWAKNLISKFNQKLLIPPAWKPSLCRSFPIVYARRASIIKLSTPPFTGKVAFRCAIRCHSKEQPIHHSFRRRRPGPSHHHHYHVTEMRNAFSGEAVHQFQPAQSSSRPGGNAMTNSMLTWVS